MTTRGGSARPFSETEQDAPSAARTKAHIAAAQPRRMELTSPPTRVCMPRDGPRPRPSSGGRASEHAGIA